MSKQTQDRVVSLSYETDGGNCGRLMIGQGTDIYDPTCELEIGHVGSCKSSSAVGLNHLVLDSAECTRGRRSASPTSREQK